MRNGIVLVVLAAAALVLSACGGPASHRIAPSASASMPTAQEQRDVLVPLVDAAQKESGVATWEPSDPPYPQACGLGNGSEGAMFTITKIGATVEDSAAAVQKVGTFLESKGMTVAYNEETINSVTQYRVLATGGGVRSISFTADSTKTSMAGVSACGTGKESDLAG
jgi:hypothetical protein